MKITDYNDIEYVKVIHTDGSSEVYGTEHERVHAIRWDRNASLLDIDTSRDEHSLDIDTVDRVNVFYTNGEVLELGFTIDIRPIVSAVDT